MAIARPSNFVDTYRCKASLSDLHELNGRGSHRQGTQFVRNRIIEAIKPESSDVIVDIGCGDGGLMASLENRVAKVLGTCASPEEVARLEKNYVNSQMLFFSVATDSLPFESNSATKVICNNVLHCLSDRETQLKTLEEIVRIAAPGGLIWLGEVLDRDEQAGLKVENPLKRLVNWIRYFYQDNSGQNRFETIRRVFNFLTALLIPGSVFIIHPKKTLYLEPEVLIAFLEKSGAQLLMQRRHLGLQPTGVAKEIPTRTDYLFQKRV